MELQVDGSSKGIAYNINMDVAYNISYDYEEGVWSQLTNIAIKINGVYIGDAQCNYTSKDFRVKVSYAYRDIKLVKNTTVRIGITVDEYGQVDTYAYVL